METEELIDFLDIKCRSDVQQGALGILVSLSGNSNASEIPLFSNSELWQRLTDLLINTNDEVALKQILCILINLSSQRLNMEFLKQILSPESLFRLFSLASDEKSSLMPQSCILLSNLTREESSLELLFQSIQAESFAGLVVKLAQMFSTTEFAEEPGFLLRNLTQLNVVRQSLVVESSALRNCCSLLRRLEDKRLPAAIDVIRNCCFDQDLHAHLVRIEGFLPCLLWPVAGPEELDDEETDCLPVELQYLEETKVRHSDARVRISVLETLYQLCATSTGRIFLRDNGTYYLLRELHKWEQNTEAELYISNVIGVLIRTEDEIGCDKLKDLTSPAE